MLVLTRGIGETITIGNDVTVTVLGVSGNQVRLGTSAPDHVAIHREGVYNRIRQSAGGAHVLNRRRQARTGPP